MARHLWISLALTTWVVAQGAVVPSRAEAPPEGRAKGGGPMATTERAVVAGSNRFGFDLYGKLRDRSGNLFFSPYSIATALAMTSAGARGETDRELAAVLHAPDDPAARHAGFHALIARVNGERPAQGQRRLDTLTTANALWLQQGDPFLPAFLEATKRDYGAEPYEVNFAGNAEAARQRINAWVEAQTAAKIREIIQPSDLDRNTSLVLTNAIYFKGAWASPFTPAHTRKDGVFTAAGGKKVTVPMMAQTETYRYHDGGSFQALELPYAGDQRSMLVLLPKAVDGLAALESSLTPDTLDTVVGKLGRQRVDLELPRFRLEETFQLADVLRSLGMERSFDPSRADFSGMTGKRDLAISKVIHKAFVDVNEEGTEAAAATAVTMVRSAAVRPGPTATFRADHPFLFLIRDQKTGAILFLGRVNEPRG